MSRRITLAILLTVWAMLIAGGGVAYWTTRSLLLADLDDALVGQALSRPELLPTARRPAGRRRRLRDGERYVIQNAVDGRRSRAAARRGRAASRELIGASFSTRATASGSGPVTVRAWTRPQVRGRPADAGHRDLHRFGRGLPPPARPAGADARRLRPARRRDRGGDRVPGLLGGAAAAAPARPRRSARSTSGGWTGGSTPPPCRRNSSPWPSGSTTCSARLERAFSPAAAVPRRRVARAADAGRGTDHRPGGHARPARGRRRRIGRRWKMRSASRGTSAGWSSG